MRHLKIFLISCLLLPALGFAENFSKVFVGMAGNNPIKLQITNVNNQLKGNFEYNKSFDNSYIPDLNYVSGSDQNNVIKLSSIDESKNKINFIGKLVQIEAKGIPTYQLNGKWEDTTHTINGPVTFTEQTFLINNNAWLVNQFSSAADNKNFYSLQLSYPQIKGKDADNAAKTINSHIQNFIQTQTKTFAEQVLKNNKTEHFSNMNSDSNTLSISNVVTASTPKILSIRFQLDTYFSHAAHPLSTFVSLNFDPATGKALALSDLFKANSNYLNTIANEVRPQLLKKLYPNLKSADPKNDLVKWIYKGTAPDNAKNYQTWNVYNDNLVLTFDPYQVAAYVYGPQTIMVPLNKLSVANLK